MLVEFPTTAPGAERGVRVLFDPALSHRCSPLSFAGPARFTPPACQPAELPEVDLVVLSHSHYVRPYTLAIADQQDHTDLPTLKTIARSQHGKAVAFVAPLGNRKWFRDNLPIEASQAVELDWWQEAEVDVGALGKLRLTATPAQHFCASLPSAPN